ncbi:hypothetical protein IW262DRAFT_1456244 [Armillaria fumosa]|nr:hypothetical protein IW262DRAFT_1456244 [Armillaria fumosa]
MLKLLCFVSLAAVSVSALLPGTYHIMNKNGNVLKLDTTSSRVVLGPGDNAFLPQVWRVMNSMQLGNPDVYTIMPMAEVDGFMTFDRSGENNTLRNGDNAIVQPGIIETPELRWTISQVYSDPNQAVNVFYTITYYRNMSFNVDLKDGSKQEGAEVQAYQSASGNVNQWWKFEEAI